MELQVDHDCSAQNVRLKDVPVGAGVGAYLGILELNSGASPPLWQQVAALKHWSAVVWHTLEVLARNALASLPPEPKDHTPRQIVRHSSIDLSDGPTSLLRAQFWR